MLYVLHSINNKMPYQELPNIIMMPRARKRFGYSQLLGTQFFGYSRFGEYNDYAGVYQYWNSWGQRKHIRKLFHWPMYSSTPAIEASREKFRDAMTAWSALTSYEKLKYNKRATPKQMWGRNLFIREYFASH